MPPFAAAVERLTTIPGVDQRTAESLVAEIGTDMERFPTADHLASWAGMSPGNDQTQANGGAAGRPREIAGCARR